MKTLYWICTSLVCLMVFASALSYFFHQATITGVRELGFPDFFRIQLGILKFIAVIILLLPVAMLPIQVKEWAYAGIALFFLTAIVAHTAHGDPVALSLVSVFFFGLLVVSNITMYKLLAQ